MEGGGGPCAHPGEHLVREAQLLEAAQALELARVKDGGAQRVEPKGAVDGVLQGGRGRRCWAQGVLLQEQGGKWVAAPGGTSSLCPPCLPAQGRCAHMSACSPPHPSWNPTWKSLPLLLARAAAAALPGPGPAASQLPLGRRLSQRSLKSVGPAAAPGPKLLPPFRCAAATGLKASLASWLSGMMSSSMADSCCRVLAAHGGQQRRRQRRRRSCRVRLVRCCVRKGQ